MQTDKTSAGIVVSALKARSGFGKLLLRVENEHRSLVIEKRGTPRAVLLKGFAGNSDKTAFCEIETLR